MFPYLGFCSLHPPRRLSVLQKRVISTDGKLLKCPEGSSSSVLLKKGRFACCLPHRCLEGSKLLSDFSVLLCFNRCLGFNVGSIRSLWCPSVWNWKVCPKSKGWSRALGTLAYTEQGMESSSWHTSLHSHCKLKLWAFFLSLGCWHWYFLLVTGSFLICRVLWVHLFDMNTSVLLSLNVHCSCFWFSEPVPIMGLNKWWPYTSMCSVDSVN